MNVSEMPLPDPRRTALIVIDVQNDFCHPDGFMARSGRDVTAARAVLPHVRSLLAAARAAGVLPVFVQLVGDASTDSPVWAGRDVQRREICRTGTWGAQLMEIAPLPSEPVIAKTRYSAFHKTSLEALLRERGIEALVFCGVSTNVCVESSIRDAFMRDYPVVLAADACAAYATAAHEAALQNVRLFFGRLATTAEIVSAWTGAPAPAEERLRHAERWA